MIQFRSFRNNDTPLLVDVWRSQPSQRGLMQPMSSTLFESMVLAKPYFDAAALTVAVDGDRALGFAHAAFGPTQNLDGLSFERGAVSLILARPTDVPDSLPADLLAASEEYLTRRGARHWNAGGLRPVDPFYLGLYGGSEISGILESDLRATELYTSSGYVRERRSIVLHLDLARLRANVDRKQMQIRRRTSVRSVIDPPCRSWWEACTYGGFDRVAFELCLRDSHAPLGRVMLWAMQPIATTWGVQAFGLVDLEVRESERRLGAASYLVGEALRHMQAEGVSLIETHVRDDNAVALALFRKMGFEPVDAAVAYCKDRDSSAT